MEDSRISVWGTLIQNKMFLWHGVFRWIMGLMKITTSDYQLFTYVSQAIWSWHFFSTKGLPILFLNIKDYFVNANLFSHRILIVFPAGKKKSVSLFLWPSNPASCINHHSLFTARPLEVLFETIYVKVLITFISGLFAFSSIYLRPVKSLHNSEESNKANC